MTFEEKHAGNGSQVGKSELYLGKKHQASGKPVANGKAQVSVKQEANGECDVPRKSLDVYSWQEIQRHNQEADLWLVINRKVYDVTGWVDRHPGGRRVLGHYAGEDATVRTKFCLLSVLAAGWLGPWLSSQKYVFKLHNRSPPPTPIFQDCYPASSWKQCKPQGLAIIWTRFGMSSDVDIGNCVYSDIGFVLGVLF